MADDTAPARATPRRAKRRRRLVLAPAALVFVMAVMAGAKPLYHWLKGRRADRLAVQAERLIEQQKFSEAAADYRAALKLDPFGYRPLRGAAMLATRLHHREALGLWSEVAKSPCATVSDREENAALLLQAGALPQAQKAIDQLLQENPSTRALLLAADYSIADGNAARAIEYARLAVKRAPGDEAAESRLAEVLGASSESGARAEAKEILWSIISRNGSAKRSAIEALTRAPELTAEEQAKLLAVVRALSPFTVAEALLAANLDLRMHPENEAAIYEDLMAKWRSEESARAALAQWLNLRGQSTRVLDLAPLQPEDNALLLARLDALAAQKRWAEIEAALARKDLRFDASVIEAFRARAAQEQYSTLDAGFHWENALTAAQSDPQKLRFIANFAEQSGTTNIALRAFEQLGRLPEQALFALSEEQRLKVKTRDTSAVRDLAQEALALQKNNPDAQNRLLYYELLLQNNVGENAAKAKELAAKFPTRLEFRVTAALGCLRQRDAAEALAQFAGPAIDWGRTQPAWRAVYAAALIANGQTARANEVVKTISMERLSKEEAQLISVERKPGVPQ